MIMRGLAVTFFVLVGLGSIALWSISIVEQGKSQIIQVQIEIEQNGLNDRFITPERIDSLLRIPQGVLVGKAMNELDMGNLNRFIRQDAAVASCEIVLGVDGIVRAKVKERLPILRVLNPSGNGFYLDKEGNSFSLLNYAVAQVPVFLTETEVMPMEFPVKSEYYTADVLNGTYLDEMCIFGLHIHNNPDLNDLIEHVSVKSYGGFEVTPRIGNQVIDYGVAYNLDTKTKMLFEFYKTQSNRINLEKYERINLNYNRQVVCVKRGEIALPDTTKASTIQPQVQQPQ
jgi:cell division protein FtsQ